jgi:quercetin dioxygenase-like cupin family protein/catechol 2,3-dioxygenase-like lactoylglutathione lyase family enzyme
MLRLRHDDLPFRGSSHQFVGADQGSVGMSAFLFDGPPGSGPGPHRHPYDEIQFIRSGRGRWTVEGETFEAGAGDILVIKAGEVHAFTAIGEERLVQLDVHLAPRIMQENLPENSGASPGAAPAVPQAGWYTPMLHVRSLERSIPFYETLGFEVVDTDRCEPLGWARLHCRGAAVMLLRSEEPVEASEAVLFYMYTPDLPAFREHVAAKGYEISEIQYPWHGPAGEAYLQDPDGYQLGVMHWGEKEHTEWLQRIGRS